MPKKESGGCLQRDRGHFCFEFLRKKESEAFVFNFVAKCGFLAAGLLQAACSSVVPNY